MKKHKWTKQRTDWKPKGRRDREDDLAEGDKMTSHRRDYLEQDSTGQATVEGTDRGPHLAVDGQCLSEAKRSENRLRFRCSRANREGLFGNNTFFSVVREMRLHFRSTMNKNYTCSLSLNAVPSCIFTFDSVFMEVFFFFLGGGEGGGGGGWRGIR